MLGDWSHERGGNVKVVVLAGGLGTRRAEETEVRSKPPMAEIEEHPILWHIMKVFGERGFPCRVGRR